MVASHYVYLHKRASDGRVFYVGKGFGKRAWKKTQRSDWWKRIEAKHGRTVEIFMDGLQEWYAFELEAELIDFYGRENLCNLRDGGHGGINPSEETRQKMSIARKGRKDSPETLEKKRLASLGRSPSMEARKKISASLKGNKSHGWSKESREKLSKSLKGRIFSAEHGKRISEAKKGKTGRKLPAHEIEAIKERLSKTIYCSNGMIFKSQLHAIDFLKKQGHSPSDNSAISRCATGKTGYAYGFVWGYDDSVFGKKPPTPINEKKPIKCSNGMIFASVSDAGQWVMDSGLSKCKANSNISSCLTNKLKSAYGLTWAYA